MITFTGLMNISRQLIWPAAAGNILWAALTLLSEQIAAGDFSRTEDHLTFLALFIYLSGSFLAGRELEYLSRKGPFEKILAAALEYLHILLVCVLSITVYLDLELKKLALVLIFAATSFMHALQLSPNSRGHHKKYVMPGISGIISLIFVSSHVPRWEAYSVFVSLLVALLSWLALRILYPPGEGGAALPR